MAVSNSNCYYNARDYYYNGLLKHEMPDDLRHLIAKNLACAWFDSTYFNDRYASKFVSFNFTRPNLKALLSYDKF